MNALLQQVVDTWIVNNRINLALLAQLNSPELEACLSKKGARTVAGQFAHLHSTRLKWLETAVPALFNGQEKIKKEEVLSKALLVKHLTASAAAIASWMETADETGKLKGYKKGVIQLLGYLVAHESHHRGNILLTLKQCGFKQDERLKWGIWDWDKF